MQEKIKNLIREALKNLFPDKDIFDEKNIMLEHPENSRNGDYSTNEALVWGSINTLWSGNPKELAEKIVEEIKKSALTREDLGGFIERIEAKNGFINFYLAREFFVSSVKKILEQKENFGKNELLSGKKIMVEYTDPNPFKEFHIGHLMSNTIGESISRIIEASGAEVKRACYQGDVGLHVAKTIWGLKNKGLLIVKDIHQSAVAYAIGSSSYESFPEIKQEIEEINKKIYNRTDEEINRLYDSGREESLKHFETIYKKLGTKFDFYFFESESADTGKEIVEKNIGNVFEKSDGATVFKAEKYDPKLHTRVFINSQGLPTYEAKELGLAKIKYDKYLYTDSIVITGNEVNDYFKVLLCAMKYIFPELAVKTKHLSHGMLRLPEGKMSSRTGDVITTELLLSEVSKKVIEKVKETNRGDMSDEFINQITVAALKYSILKNAMGGDIIYDFEKSISFEGDSGPYLQYSYARAKSILEKAKNENVDLVAKPPSEWETVEIEKILYKFGEVVMYSMQEFEPHHIANYLIELARAYNAFYGNTKIVDKDDPASSYKVALTEAFSIVIKNGLYLLGIKTPERM